jgi:hypothetical protein
MDTHFEVDGRDYGLAGWCGARTPNVLLTENPGEVDCPTCLGFLADFGSPVIQYLVSRFITETLPGIEARYYEGDKVTGDTLVDLLLEKNLYFDEEEGGWNCSALNIACKGDSNLEEAVFQFTGSYDTLNKGRELMRKFIPISRM